MKKRKPPIVLGTVLAVLLVAVGIMYSPKGKDDGHGHNAQQQPPPAIETGERAVVDSEQVAAMASQSLKPPSGQGGPVPRPVGDKEGNTPSIAMPKQSDYRPVPNESATSTQWYTDQTGKK